MKVFGPSYIERAFNLVHAADLQANLFLNEQAIDRVSFEKNRVAFLRVVDQLLGKGVPLHGVGFESHIIYWTGGTLHQGVMWLLGELQKRDLEVHISEFDVSVFGDSNGVRPHSITDPTVIDPFAATFARPCIRDVLSFSNVKVFICWSCPTSIRTFFRISSGRRCSIRTCSPSNSRSKPIGDQRSAGLLAAALLITDSRYP
jgi:endo-1,4-beta-xylanase